MSLPWYARYWLIIYIFRCVRGTPIINFETYIMKKDLHQYWLTNLRYMLILLIIWFVVSFGCGILWVDQLDKIQFGGFKLGFWFAQQGSIYGFVILVFVYIYLMNRLDKAYDVDEKD